MSISHLSYVRCDRCGNPAEPVAEGAKEARRVARAQGFRRGGESLPTGTLFFNGHAFSARGTRGKQVCEYCGQTRSSVKGEPCAANSEPRDLPEYPGGPIGYSEMDVPGWRPS